MLGKPEGQVSPAELSVCVEVARSPRATWDSPHSKKKMGEHVVAELADKLVTYRLMIMNVHIIISFHFTCQTCAFFHNYQ